jgi:hypothetical protein
MSGYSMADLTARIEEIAREQPDADAADLAARLIKEIPRRVYRDIVGSLAQREIEWEIGYRQRVHARQVEQEARRLAAEQPQPEPQPEPAPEPNHRPEEFQRLYDDPTLWHDRPGGVLRVERICKPSQSWLQPFTVIDRVRWSSTSREQFQQWCESTHGDGAFQSWLDRGILLVAEEPEEMERFEHDWVPRWLSESALDRMFYNDINRALQDYADKIRFEVTAELLDTVFAIGDGTKVSWRDATVTQHEQRVELLTKMIVGTTETAAMHIRAVRMIKDAGVDTLGQLAEADGTARQTARHAPGGGARGGG